MTTHLVPEEISMIFSSDPVNGALNTTPDGDRFLVILEDGLKIPRHALNVTVEAQESSIWWTVPNILTGVNDTLYITGPDTSDVIQVFSIVFPQGLYDLKDLNESLQRELENAGTKTFDAAQPNTKKYLIQFYADTATQKVEIRVNYPNVLVDFTQNDTPRDILGFDALSYGPYPLTPYKLLAPNVAMFNTIDYFLIHTDLLNKGIRINNQYSQTISQVQIDVSPGSQIISRPFNPTSVSADELAGSNRNNLRFWLTDDKNRAINTASEYWSVRLVIKYLLPMII